MSAIGSEADSPVLLTKGRKRTFVRTDIVPSSAGAPRADLMLNRCCQSNRNSSPIGGAVAFDAKAYRTLW